VGVIAVNTRIVAPWPQVNPAVAWALTCVACGCVPEFVSGLFHHRSWGTRVRPAARCRDMGEVKMATQAEGRTLRWPSVTNETRAGRSGPGIDWRCSLANREICWTWRQSSCGSGRGVRGHHSGVGPRTDFPERRGWPELSAEVWLRSAR
jgi:hypothetical protein